MDPNWETVTRLFDRIIQSAPEERDRLLEQIKTDHPEIYREVASLLQEEDNLHPLLREELSPVYAPLEDQHLIGTRVGPFRLTQMIGAGGMGSVFAGERVDGEFEQRVAIKLIRPQLLDHLTKERFRQERQILARLQHPNIARLYDGGLSESGRLFFTMEWVSGVPIDQYVKENRLDTHQILSLFLQACEAVQYAHENLIVHQDLKPGNILVNQQGRVKLLDFGIAWIMDPGLSGPEERAFTLAYAAPEQYRHQEVTTRTDIFSLGIVLYELLAGRHPFVVDLRKAQNPRQFRDDFQFPRPSSDFHPEQRTEAQPPGRELDAICLKALEEKPEDRYASAETLANDLRSYLADRPISLFSGDRFYRFRKQFIRNRLAYSLAAGFFLALAAIIGFFGVQLARERNTAIREAERARQIKELTLDIFRNANPNEIQRSDISGVEILTLGLTNLEEQLQDQPDLLPEMYTVIGDAYKNLGYFEEAVQVSEKALRTAVSLYAPPHPVIAEQLLNLASVYSGEYVELEKADSLAREAHQMLVASTAREPALEGDILVQLATGAYDRSDFPEADSLYRTALARYRSLEEPQPADEAFCLHMIGTCYRKQEQWEQAETYLLRAKEKYEELYSPPHVDLAWNLNHLASLYLDQNQPEKAEPYARAAWMQRKAIFGDDHMETMASRSNLGRILFRMEKYEDALYHFTGAYDALTHIFGESHPYMAAMLSNIAQSERELGDLEKAERLYRQAMAMEDSLLTPENVRRTHTQVRLGDLLLDRDRPREALPLLEQAVDLRSTHLPKGHRQIAEAQTLLSRCLIRMGRVDEAYPILKEALAIYRRDTLLHGENWREAERLLQSLKDEYPIAD